MGGTYQCKDFLSIEELVEFVKEQVVAANEVGLYLSYGAIKQRPFPEKGFRWSAYFSK